MALTIIIFTVGKSCKPFCINEFKPFEFEKLQKSSLAFNVTVQISSSSLDPLQLGRAISRISRLLVMALPVMEFQDLGYKIRKIFA